MEWLVAKALTSFHFHGFFLSLICLVSATKVMFYLLVLRQKSLIALQIQNFP